MKNDKKTEDSYIKTIKIESIDLEELGISKEDWDEYLGLFCKCDKPSEDHVYVKNYNGVNHGYICTKCKKFIQIG